MDIFFSIGHANIVHVDSAHDEGLPCWERREHKILIGAKPLREDMQKSNVVRTTGAHPHSGRFLNHLDFPSIGRG